MNWLSRDLVAKTRRAIPLVICGLVAAGVASMVPACSTAAPPNDSSGGTGTTPGGADGGSTTNQCDHPAPGCPCSEAKETAPCGKVTIRSGDFFQCEEGTTTCDGSKWGACDGDIKVEGQAIKGGGFALQSLGKAMTCGAVNPCDPYCYVQIDTAPGLDAGPGLTVQDGGLQVAIPAGLNTCNEATNPGTVYSTAAVGAYAANPSSCTSGVSDNCNFDYVCQTTGGACTPYGDGVSKTVGTCQTEPDFTTGLGCWDTSAANGSGLELQVCNRGGVTAGLGNLVVAIESGAPSPALAAGSCPAGSKVATGPALPTTGTTSGTCTINLATTPIGAGECLSFNVVNPPSAITCKASNGGTITPTASQMFAVVNPPTSILSTYTPLAECDACNNFTAINNASLPTGTPATGAGACTQTWCGFTAGSSGGAACATNIVGTVMDPGMNVGLSNVAVYVATSAPITIPDEPANTTAGANPTCDNCASLSTPGYLNGVVTRTDGTFTLSVTPGIYTVIAQLGRWRRIVTNLSVPACSNTTIPTASISMPQNHTQGDIPKMAIVEGNQESLECWLTKVGISASEIAPYASGATQRIQLYNSAYNAGVSYWNSTSATVVAPPVATTLWDTTMNDYSAILVNCDGSSDYSGTHATATEKGNMYAYLNNGGRVFLDHWPGETWIENQTNGDWASSNVASWSNNSTTPGTQNATVEPGTSPVQLDQQAMDAWLSAWDNTPNGAGHISSVVPRTLVTATGSESVELVYFPSLANDVASFWFNTPTTASAGSYCGRMVFNDMHVSSTRSSNLSGGTSQSNTFPASCSTSALTSEELALEYEMFQLSACNLGVSNPIPPPPPPPPPTPLMATTFKRTFQANCSPGFTVRWGFFEWEASIPTGTSISFAAKTAPDGTSGMPGTYGASVSVGNATSSSVGVYATSANTVDTDLTAAGQTSQDFLEVDMTLNPTAEVSPVLTNWQQLYDCVP